MATSHIYGTAYTTHRRKKSGRRAARATVYFQKVQIMVRNANLAYIIITILLL